MIRKNQIEQKINIINKGDINLDGESEDFKKGFVEGLEWVLNQGK